MREKSKLREEDIKLSNNIYDFLDKTFYATEVTNFERVNDKTRQVGGIDTIFEIDGKKYIADEKAAVRWRNLMTYSLELSFINKKGEVQDGWFIRDDLQNDSYVFVWIDEKEGKEYISLVVVKKEKILEHLKTLGWTKESLRMKESLIRNGTPTYMGRKEIDGYKFSFSKQLVEKPINIILPRSVYENLSDKIWSCELN